MVKTTSGQGQLDKNGQIVPIVSAQFPAEPGMSYKFNPVAKYYVADTSYVQSSAVDIGTGSLNPGEIHFSSGEGQGKATAIVTIDSSNNFTIEYE
ncbi:uncharacterized protein KY384_001675 [Bacidia gigantensis]|uniref:uncharacterized protein n=1 Tax=Bacidia gigantensis TaxID=2732470 RepID=UPI001D04B6C3|nr:uncharacterized protein KY384_001675 [Bacidia gigantensis]KAG8533934.1 hypothetical protein KY384_001675 [Bacidia gigantensis]